MSLNKCYSCGCSNINWADKSWGDNSDEFWYFCMRCGLTTRGHRSLLAARQAWQAHEVDYTKIHEFHIIDEELTNESA